MNSSQWPVIGKNPETVVSIFRISGQSLINENCHNSKTSADNEMKLSSETRKGKYNSGKEIC